LPSRNATIAASIRLERASMEELSVGLFALASRRSSRRLLAGMTTPCRAAIRCRSHARLKIRTRSHLGRKMAHRLSISIGFDSDFWPKICSNVPASQRRRSNAPKGIEDRRRYGLWVSPDDACFPRRLACPTLKCIRKCAGLMITEKPGNLRYRQAFVSQILRR
jgi:hypothetical protein